MTIRDGTIYVRVAPRELPIMDWHITDCGQKKANHPSVDWLCPACMKPMRVNDHTGTIVLGPGDDPDAQERCRQGRPYPAIALEAHWSCLTGL